MRLLLLSNSTQHGRAMLDHAESAIRDHFDGVSRILFVPFALRDHEAYTATVAARLHEMGFTVEGLQEFDDPVAAVAEAEAIYVGGGNSFRLLRELRTRKLLDPIRARVEDGVPYMGASAGSNLAGPTIRTTNDMPIVDPKGFGALDLVPFQINPHYLDAAPSGHMGETREKRIEEYLEENNKVVLGLREGGWLQCEDGRLELFGLRPARIFQRGTEPREVASPADLSTLLA
ncbi:dipeptidase PepE [bacterium]|nr:MAG: dipeptidase PepE [bacterium]